MTLEIIPDDHELTLTLLLPQINLKGRGGSFESLAIRTRHLSRIGGLTLVKGSLQTYDVLPLHGTRARLIDPPGPPRQVAIYVDGENRTYPAIFGETRHRLDPGYPEFIPNSSPSAQLASRRNQIAESKEGRAILEHETRNEVTDGL